jgi:hypothetical protein
VNRQGKEDSLLGFLLKNTSVEENGHIFSQDVYQRFICSSFGRDLSEQEFHRLLSKVMKSIFGDPEKCPEKIDSGDVSLPQRNRMKRGYTGISWKLE